MTPELRAQMNRLARLSAGRPAAYADEVDEAYEALVAAVLDLGVMPVDDDFDNPDYLEAQRLGNEACEAAQSWRLACLHCRPAEMAALSAWFAWWRLRFHVSRVTGDDCDQDDIPQPGLVVAPPFSPDEELGYGLLPPPGDTFTPQEFAEALGKPVPNARKIYSEIKRKVLEGCTGDVIRDRPGCYGRVS